MADTPPTVALVAGSTRRASIHRRLASVIVDALETRGVHADAVDLADYPMPIYHGDLEVESGLPPAAVDLHDRIAAHDGLILLSPEYNGGPTALLKNAIDWVTRVDRATLRRPLVGLASASPGSRGAAHVLGVMRSIGEHMRLPLVDTDFSLPHAGDAFERVGPTWWLTRPGDVERLGTWLDDYAERLHEHRSALVSVGEDASRR